MATQVAPPHSTNLAPTTFRLLRFVHTPSEFQALESQILRFTIHEESVDGALSYDALSYRWEDPSPDFPECKLYCDDVETPIGQNLYLALLQIAQLPDRIDYLWVDCLCINQLDEVEKQIQILNMSQIYSRAHRVIIWIGPASDVDQSDEVLTFFPKLLRLLDAAEKYFRGEPDEGTTKEEIEANIPVIMDWGNKKDPRTIYTWKVFSRSWFSRAWTVQEAALASEDSIILCGATTMRYSLVHYFADRVMNDNDGTWIWVENAVRCPGSGVDLQNLALPPFSSSVTVSRMRRAWNERTSSTPRKTSVVRILNSLRMLECTNARDRIFSASAFLPGQLVQELRIGGAVSARELYIKFATSELGNNGNTQCISAAGLCQQRRSYPSRYPVDSSSPSLELPSWVPDWAYRKANEPLWILDLDMIKQRNRHLYEAATAMVSETSVTDYVGGSPVASVRGAVLGTISACLTPFRPHVVAEGTIQVEQPERILAMLLDYTTQIEQYISAGTEHLQAWQRLEPSVQLLAVRETLVGSLMSVIMQRHNANSLMIRSQPEHVNLMYEDFEKDVEFMRLICANGLCQPDAATPDDLSAEELDELVKQNTERAQRPSLMTMVAHMYTRRRFFTASDGMIGMGPEITQNGDRICIFHGACTPFIIRPATSINQADGCSYYQLVGECYVHGLMDREALERQDLVAEDIPLV